MACIVTSCAEPGEHTTACLTPWTSRRWLPAGQDLCPGCAPRPVDVGLLCQHHVRQLRRLLAEAPAQHTALLADLTPTHRGARERVAPVREPGVPIAIDPLDTAVEIADLLSGMVGALALLYPEDPPPAQLRTMDSRQHDTGGEAPRWDPHTSAPWLRGRTARLASLVEMGEGLPLLAWLMGRGAHLAPVPAHRPQLLACVPCPWCHSVHLARYPAEGEVECGTCGARMLDDSYKTWVKEVQACA